MKTTIMKVSVVVTLGLTAVGVLDLFGMHMFDKPLYVPEAKQPAGFPAPAQVDLIVVKTYPAHRAAVLTADGGNQDRMFRTLFKHIKNNNIAMTAPVKMTFDEQGQSSMAFLYGNAEIGRPGREGDVEVTDVPEATVVSIAVRGDYSKERFDRYVGRLEEWIAENVDWKAAGEPRYLAYNSPFVPAPFRYGEIQIPISKRVAD